jgi:hypothetical protein
MAEQAYKALAIAQKQMKTPDKDKQNKFLKNTYASLESCFKAIVPALHKNNFVLLQRGGKDEMGHYVETSFAHATGKEFTSRIYLIIEKNNMQGLGSAITYAKRYGLLSLAGQEPNELDDDDAEEASKTPRKDLPIPTKEKTKSEGDNF